MNQLQLQHLLLTRKNLERAQSENAKAQLQFTAYRGVPYSKEHSPAESHGSFTYRGNSYTK